MTEKQQRQEAAERPDEDVDFPVDGEAAEKTAADWGLKKPKSGMGKELKIGLAVLTLIGGVFGYVLYKNSADSADAEGEKVTQNDENSNEQDQNKTAAPAPPAVVQAKNTIPSKPDDLPPGELTDFSEPADDVNARYAAAREQQQRYDNLIAQENAAVGAEDYAAQDDWEADPGAAGDLFGGNQTEPAHDDLPPQQDDRNLFDSQFDSQEEIATLDEPTEVNPYESGGGQEDFSTGQNDFGEPLEGDITQFDDTGTGTYGQDDPYGQQPRDNGQFGGTAGRGHDGYAADDYSTLDDQDYGNEGGYQSPLDAQIAGQGEPHMTGDIETAETGNEFDQGDFRDPRAGEYRGVTPHTGRAGSTTIVRRADDFGANAETETGARADADGRIRGFHSVGNYRDQAQQDLAGQRNGMLPQDHLPSGQGENTLAEPTVDDWAADDNRSYGFDARQPVADTLEPSMAEPSGTYVVESNDSFWSIARQAYGDAKYFQALAKYNAQTIPDPRAMRPGVVVATPPAEELHRLFPELLGGVQQASQQVPQPIGQYPAAADAGLDDSGIGEFGSREGYAQPDGSASDTATADGFFLAPDGRPHYRVISGDNLGSIARRHLGKASRWEEVFRLNQDHLTDPHRLKIGTVLRLPNDARREQVVGRPIYGR